MNTPLCIHLRKTPRRFHFNAVLQVVSIITFCHDNRPPLTLAALSILADHYLSVCGPRPMPLTQQKQCKRCRAPPLFLDGSTSVIWGKSDLGAGVRAFQGRRALGIVFSAPKPLHDPNSYCVVNVFRQFPPTAARVTPPKRHPGFPHPSSSRIRCRLLLVT